MFSEVWDKSLKEIRDDLKYANKLQERWIGSQTLIHLLRSGLRNCSYDTRTKIVYGFEQILP